MRFLRERGKQVTLGTVLAVGGLGFAAPVAADADYTFREPKRPNAEVEENFPVGKPTGNVGEPGTERSNQPYAGERIQEQEFLTGEAKGDVGEPGTERENPPTEDAS